MKTTQSYEKVEPKIAGNEIITLLEEDTGLDFSESKEKVNPEIIEIVRKQSIETAKAINTEFGRYLPKSRQQWLNEVASVPTILVQRDLDKIDAYSHALSLRNSGKDIDLDDVVNQINNPNKNLEKTYAAATLWHPITDDRSNSFTFFSEDAYLNESEDDSVPQTWLEHVTAEEQIHALDCMEFSPEEYNEYEKEIEILREGAANTLIHNVISKDAKVSIQFESETANEMRIWSALEQEFGDENLRRYYFTGERNFDQTLLLIKIREMQKSKPHRNRY